MASSAGGVDQAKLAKLQAQAAAMRIGGKGGMRRKVVPQNRPGQGGDDKKLQGALKKLSVQPIQGVEEVNMFKEDGNVIHFTAPKVHASIPSNTFAIYGQGQDKELTELVPGILNQLGPEAIASLRKIAESYQNAQANAGAMGPGGVAVNPEDKEADEDEEPPELVASDEVKQESKLDDIN